MEYQKKLANYASKHKEIHDDIMRQSEMSTFDISQHNMQVEAYPQDIISVYNDLQDMERAELYDHFELERKYGRANKKR